MGEHEAFGETLMPNSMKFILIPAITIFRRMELVWAIVLVLAVTHKCKADSLRQKLNVLCITS